MLRLPYGISNFKTLVTEGYHYVDRTSYVELLENLDPRYLFFLRPRRFGKSLFISLLQHYYGLEHKKDFQTLFGKYYIGKNPTPNVNKYLVLKIDFSRVDSTSKESTFQGFLRNVKRGVNKFMAAYPHIFDEKDRMTILNANAPNILLLDLFDIMDRKKITQKIYLLIDEYDHFANELIAFDIDNFSNIVSRNGYVRKFYETIKVATHDGIVDRIFITGVSPITLDSLTSGFNIATGLTIYPNFNEMMGFTEQEVKFFFDNIDFPKEKMPDTLANIKKWYNGYLFHENAQNTLYNPDMVLSFLHHYTLFKEIPKNLLAPNIASDYGKIKRLFNINDRQQNWKTLEKIIENGKISAKLTREFSFEKVFDKNDFVSLLFYLGLLTVKGSFFDRTIFTIPNYVIKMLYFDHFQQLIMDKAQLTSDEVQLEEHIFELAQYNRIHPFLAVVERILKSLSSRDALKFDEKHLKVIFTSLFYVTGIYTIQSEFAVGREHVDLFLARRPPYEPPYQFVFELKYLKKSGEKQLETVKKEATQQLKKYLQHETFAPLNDLKAYVVVFVGTDVKAVEVLR